MVFRTNGSDNMVIDGVGNVGINETSPGSKLQVNTSDERGTMLNSTVTDKLIYSQINAHSSTSGAITGAAALELVGQADASGHGRHAWIGAEGSTGTTFETKLKFKIRGETASGYDWAGSAEAPTIMTLEGDGNVGIGTTSPGAKLDVDGNILISDTDNDKYFGSNVNLILNADADANSGDSARNIIFQNRGSEKMRIIADGNVGIGDTNPVSYKLAVSGNVKGDSFGTDQTTTARIFAPSGAAYNGAGNSTGYLIMQLPDNAGAGINNMMSGVIRVFDYAFGESFDVRFSGYWYSGYNWTNCTAWVINESGIERNFPVKFGASTGASGSEDRPYIAIGDTASTWSYCKFSVIEYTSGHSNTQLYKWNSGWAASLNTTLPGSVLVTVSNTQTNNWKRTGYDLSYNNGGNVGIGTTLPGSKLEVNVIDDNFDDIDVLRLKRTWATASGSDRAHGILFNDSNSRMATIYADRTNSGSNYNSDLLFATNTGTSGTSLSTKMVIKAGGSVGIGNTSPDKLLHVGNGSAQLGSPQGAEIEGYNNTLDLKTNEGNSIADFTAALNLFCDGVVGSSGTGTGIYFRAKTGGGGGGEYTTGRIQGAIYTSWTTNTDATRTSKLVLQTTNSGTHADRVTILGNGDFGINDTSPSNKLDVNGDIRGTEYKFRGNFSTDPTTTAISIYDRATVGLTLSAHSVQMRGWNGTAMVRSALITYNTATFTGTCTATNFILSSDETLKENVKDIDNNHVDVTWKNFELKSEPGVKRSGVIAQELEKKHPEFVRTDDEGLKSVAYIDLLIAKIAELEARLEKAGL
jgi:hypothetical protein